MNIQPMFCKHIVHLYYHGICRYICSVKKFDNYMTRFHLSFKKWTIRTNVAIPPLDIQKSKNIMHVLHDSWKARKTNIYFVHSIIIGKSSILVFCYDGKFNQRFYLRINLLKKGASTNDKGTSSFAMNNTTFSSNCFLWKSFLL